MKRSRPWMKLDNAALVYPAARRRNWNALFRVSATLTEPVDKAVLRQALERTLKRIPTFATRLRSGLFWHYLEHNDLPPEVQEDVSNPCVRMDFAANRHHMFRVRVYGGRIALEVFHALADGTGGLVFLKTLVAEYLSLRYGALIPRGEDILDCDQPPDPGEKEDSFARFARKSVRSRREPDAYALTGTPYRRGEVDVITGLIPVDAVLERARACRATLTEYLTANLLLTADAIQRQKVPSRRRRWVAVQVPVNLRRFYPTRTLRNFSSYVNPGFDPSYGEYSLREAVDIVRHHMGAEVTEKLMNAKFSANVKPQRSRALQVTPLFLKNWVIRMVFNQVGDRKSTTSLSNLGNQRLPEEMARYVTRMDFLLGPLSRTKVACAAVSYDDTLYLNFTRTIREPDLERNFFRRLVKLGIPVRIESNRRFV